MKNTVLFLLSVAVLLHLTSPIPQTPVRDYELFVPYTNTVPLTANNITQFSVQLHWSLPVETREKLKAMRINCTTIKSLIEPYDIEPPHINLYNPSILGSHLTIHDLQPATKYSCRLVGAMSLDVGREKLAILSEAAIFSTLLEPGGGGSDSDKVDILGAIVGGTVPVTLIILAIILILIGYYFYRKSKKPAKDKSKKFRMRMSKDSSGPKPGPSVLKSAKSSKFGTKKWRKEKSEQKKKAKKEKSQQKKGKKLGGEGKKKKASKKKSLDVYAYSELVVRSSEDDIYGYKDGGNVELEADLGWDPTTYYPLPRKTQEISHPIEVNKHIQLKELSSPALLGLNDYEDEEEVMNSHGMYDKERVYLPYDSHHTEQPS